MGIQTNLTDDIPVEEFFSTYAVDDESVSETYLRVNFVTSADGAATAQGRSGGLGGANDRRLMNVLRAMSDVVLVAAGTVRAEGYGGLNLSEEVRPWRDTHRRIGDPQIVIATNSLALEPEMDVFQRAERPPIIATSKVAAETAGTRFDGVAEVLACGNDRLDLPELLRVLASRGQTQVLCEGGPHLFGSLLEADLVGEVDLTVAPLFEAGSASRISTTHEEVRREFNLGTVLTDNDGYLFLRYCRPT